MDKRTRWFEEGASLLRMVLDRLSLGDRLPSSGDYYACPCCLTAYPREALEFKLLTEEHVPPKGLGGHGLLLTCTNCNSRSGSYFDAHAVTRADADDFVRGTVNGRTLPATFKINGIPLRGVAQRTEKGIHVFGVPKQNDPKVEAAHFQALNDHVTNGVPDPASSLTFTVHTRFDETRARLSWIRSAYLAAFAALGWSYILRPSLNPLRKQLMNPQAEILPTYICRTPDVLSTTRQIRIVNDPDELRCVAVTIGEHTVFLPGVPRPLEFDELVEAFCRYRQDDDRLHVTLSGKEIPWPRRPIYFLDKPAQPA